MKKLLQTGALFLILSVATMAFANPQRDESGSLGAVQRSGSLGAVERDHYVYVFVTGSRIPQKVKVKPVGTNTVSSMSVWTRREIDRTGRVTTEGVLAQDPFVRVILGRPLIGN